MAFSYSGDPATANKDAVRFLLQDVENTTRRPALLQDEEIDWLLQQEDDVYLAAANGAERLAARARGIGRKKVGSTDIEYKPEYWEALAEKLRMRSGDQLPTFAIPQNEDVHGTMLDKTFRNRFLGTATTDSISRTVNDYDYEEYD